MFIIGNDVVNRLKSADGLKGKNWNILGGVFGKEGSIVTLDSVVNCSCSLWLGSGLIEVKMLVDDSVVSSICFDVVWNSSKNVDGLFCLGNKSCCVVVEE